MRTTLTIDDDVLYAAKAVASQERRSAGEVISEWARHALYKSAAPTLRNGIPLLKSQGAGVIVTPELVNQLRDEQP